MAIVDIKIFYFEGSRRLLLFCVFGIHPIYYILVYSFHTLSALIFAILTPFCETTVRITLRVLKASEWYSSCSQISQVILLLIVKY